MGDALFDWLFKQAHAKLFQENIEIDEESSSHLFLDHGTTARRFRSMMQPEVFEELFL